MHVGGLTVADVALWLDVPRTTVRDWLNCDKTPRTFKQCYIKIKLAALNEVIAKNNGRVIPASITLRNRKAYLVKLRVAAFKHHGL